MSRAFVKFFYRKVLGLFASLRGGISMASSAFECSVCLRLLHEPATLPCGHSFCRRCLVTCLDHQPRCPSCRTDVPSEFCSGSVAVSYSLAEAAPSAAFRVAPCRRIRAASAVGAAAASSRAGGGARSGRGGAAASRGGRPLLPPSLCAGATAARAGGRHSRELSETLPT